MAIRMHDAVVVTLSRSELHVLLALLTLAVDAALVTGRDAYVALTLLSELADLGEDAEW